MNPPISLRVPSFLNKFNLNINLGINQVDCHQYQEAGEANK